MPELPEVEVTRRSVVKNITGARIESLRLGKPLRWPLGIDPLELAGQTVLGVRRRGKYLLVDLDDGLLLLHLGMSGSLAFWPTRTNPPPPPGPHDHFDLWTDRGLLRLHDPRRFGAAVWARHEQDPVAEKLLGHLGVEPLGPDFKPDAFHAGLKTRSAPIKQVLLAGELVVGVGNIYASETLFLAGIRPSTRAQKISRPRADRLFAAIIQVLNLAVEQGGSTLRNFSNAQGEAGHFQVHAHVYGRAGEPCRVCATPIRWLLQGQRSSYFCPKCQKP